MVRQAAARIGENRERFDAQAVSLLRIQNHERARVPGQELGRERLHGVLVLLIDSGRVGLNRQFSPIAVAGMAFAENVELQGAAYVANFER